MNTSKAETWHDISENPPDGEYLIAYRYNNKPKIRYAISDYDTILGWDATDERCQTLAWKEIEVYEPKDKTP